MDENLIINVYLLKKYFGSGSYYANLNATEGVENGKLRIFSESQTSPNNNITTEQALQYSWYNGTDVSPQTDQIYFFDQQTDGSYKYICTTGRQSLDPEDFAMGTYYILKDIDGNTKYYYTSNSAGDSFGWLTDSLKTVQQVDDQYYDRWETLYDDDNNNDRNMQDISTSKRVSTYYIINGNYVAGDTLNTTRYVFKVQSSSSSDSSSTPTPNPNPLPNVVQPLISERQLETTDSDSGITKTIRKKIIYLQDSSLLFFFNNQTNNDNIQIQQTINIENGLDSNLNIDESFSKKIIDFDVYESDLKIQEDYNKNNTNITIESDIIGVIEKDIQSYNNESYRFEDYFKYRECWCNCDQVKDNKIIFKTINKIKVNDIIYNTLNISDYKFTIDDVFSFFEKDIENKLSQKKFILQRNHVYKNWIMKSSQINSDTTIKQDVVIKQNNINVQSNIDGLLLSNNINLSQGTHFIQYKVKNTACQQNFTIIVNNKFYRDINNILYEYNDNDLYKAKLIKNHILSSQMADFEDNIEITV